MYIQMNKKKKKKRKKKKTTKTKFSRVEIKLEYRRLFLHDISRFIDETTPDRKIRFLGIDTSVRDIGVASVLTTEI